MRVLLVDDEWPTLHLLANMIQKNTDLEIVGMIGKSSEVPDAVASLRPDAVFLDIEMPGANGLELAGQLTQRNPELIVVMVTAFTEYAIQAFRVNAIDYLLKPVRVEEMVRCADKLKARLSPRPSPESQSPAAKALGFGGFQVYAAAGEDDTPLSFPTLKTEEFMAYLLVNRKFGAEKWKICEQLWPDFEPSRAEQNLYTTVHRLRKLLTDRNPACRVEMHLGSYWLRGWSYCDFIDFEEKAAAIEGTEEAAVRTLESLADSYKGSLFAGKDYSWCEAERERLERKYVEIVKRLANLYIEAGEPSRAAERLRRSLEQTAYDEEGYRLLLEIFAERHDKASFLQEYDKLGRRLHEELAVSPGPYLQELFESVSRK